MNRSPILLLALVSCAAPAPETPVDPLDLRWRPREGDAYLVRVTQSGGIGSMESSGELRMVFRIRAIKPDGSAEALLEVERFAANSPDLRFVFEDGRIKEWSHGGSDDLRKTIEKLRAPLKSILSPTGHHRPADGSSEEAKYYPAGPLPILGLPLPGKKIAEGDRWSSEIQAAHCDILETEFQVVSAGDRVRIRGASTPKAEKDHKIRATVEGTYLAREGYVSESTLELDFGALSSGGKIRVAFEIRRI